MRVLELPKNWAVGQRAEVFIEVARKEDVTLLPASWSSRETTKQASSWTQGGHAGWRSVTFGLQSRDYVEVIGGLHPEMSSSARSTNAAAESGTKDCDAMNLATKDIRHNLGRFALTTVGVGMLLMVVMGMGGIYRGIVEDATLLIDRVGADLVDRSARYPRPLRRSLACPA